MINSTMRVTVALCVVWLGGCGTVDNLARERNPYGGVRQDVKRGTECLADWRHPSGH